MTATIRLLIVDDHAVVRQGLRAFLRLQEGIEVVGEAASAADAIRVGGNHVAGRRPPGPGDA